MLFLCWAVPLLGLVYWYGWRRRRRILTHFATSRTLSLLTPRGVKSRRGFKAALCLTAILLLAPALAGPRYSFRWQEVERRGVDIVIALDCSRSMLARDIPPNRLNRAKREIIDLLGMLQGDRVGLVAFSGTAFVQCPLTLDYSAFDLFLKVLSPDYLPMGGTDLAAALETALTAFDNRSDADKAILLITDGEHTGRSDPEKIAQSVKAAGIKLFCIGVGSGEGVPVPAGRGGLIKDRNDQIVLTRLDEPLLTRMAVTTGGVYMRSVAGDMDLDRIYKDRIRVTMDEATLEGGRRKVWIDHYQWPLGLSIALLVIAGMTPPIKKPIMAAAAVLLLLHPAGPAKAGPLQSGYQDYQKGDYDQALGEFIQGQLQAPDDPRVLYNLGNAYYKTGDFQSAREHFSQALSQAPPDLQARILYNLGNTAYRQGKLQEAVKNYEAALKLAPDDIQARENLAFVQRQMQRQPQQKGDQNQNNQDKNESGRQPQARDQNNRDKPDRQPGAGQRSDTDREQKRRDDKAGTESPPQQKNPEQREADASQRQPSDARERAPQPPTSQMLNRLKDEPGRAMMPNYRKAPVEKDW